MLDYKILQHNKVFYSKNKFCCEERWEIKGKNVLWCFYSFNEALIFLKKYL